MRAIFQDEVAQTRLAYFDCLSAANEERGRLQADGTLRVHAWDLLRISPVAGVGIDPCARPEGIEIVE